MNNPRKGLIFVVSAPSGCGKTTLCRRLLSVCPDLVRSVSITTRKARLQEKQRHDYKFVSVEEFQRRKKRGDFLEWAKVFGHFYGTPEKFVDRTIKKGKDILLAIDVQGALQVKAKRPEAIFIFVLPPSLKALKERLKKRGTEDPKQIKARLEVAKKEISQSRGYCYRVVNDQISKAAKRLKDIVSAERKK